MEHLIAFAEKCPELTGLVLTVLVWPLLSAGFNYLFRPMSEEEGKRLDIEAPRRAGFLRMTRGLGIDPSKVASGAMQFITGKLRLPPPPPPSGGLRRSDVDRIAAQARADRDSAERRQAVRLVFGWVGMIAVVLALVLGPVLAFAGCSPAAVQAPRAVVEAVDRTIADPTWSEEMWKALEAFEAAKAAYDAAIEAGEAPEKIDALYAALVETYCRMLPLVGVEEPDPLCAPVAAPAIPAAPPEGLSST